jgi:hypothetical protein
MARLTRMECATGFAVTRCDDAAFAAAYPPLSVDIVDKPAFRQALWDNGSIAEFKEAFYIEVRKRNPRLTLSDGDINRDLKVQNARGEFGYGGQTHINGIVSNLFIKHTHMLHEHTRALDAIQAVENFEQGPRPRMSLRIAEVASKFLKFIF